MGTKSPLKTIGFLRGLKNRQEKKIVAGEALS
jgi:hypothetical protein